MTYILAILVACASMTASISHGMAAEARSAQNADSLPDELKNVPQEAPTVKKISVPSELLVKLLEERQLELDRREAAVRREEERLKLLRQDVEALLKKQDKQTKPALAAVKATSVKAAGANPVEPPPNLVHLSQAFETMPVEEAAQRIDKMNETVALDLLARLKSKTTGQILAALNPTKAARLVERLAHDRPRTTARTDSQPERK